MRVKRHNKKQRKALSKPIPPEVIKRVQTKDYRVLFIKQGAEITTIGNSYYAINNPRTHGKLHIQRFKL